MKLNRKLWTAALAVAMTTPSAMAAQDTAGMHYTSAAEGFYASIRLRYVSNGNSKDGGANLENSSSRIGVRGTNDLGAGLEGFYQYEMLVGTDQSAGVGTRLGLVGLRGDFGSVVAGAFWPDTYNWVYGSTDVANRQSGNLTGGFGQYRTSKSLQYTTPDLNGFRGAILIKADKGSDGQGDVTKDTAATPRIPAESGMTEPVTLTHTDGQRVIPAMPYSRAEVPGAPAQKGNKDDNDIDHWSLAASYDIAGFSMGASYANNPDAMAGVNRAGHVALKGIVDEIRADVRSRAPNTAGASQATLTALSLTVDSVDPVGDSSYKKDDLTSWAVKLGYSQDNWYVNSWYGEINHGDAEDFSGALGEGKDRLSLKFGDTTVFSLAGGISVDKVAVYAVHESREKSALVRSGDSVAVKAQDDSYTTLGVQYTLGSNSWTWVEYAGQDLGSSDKEDDGFSIGLGHSF